MGDKNTNFYFEMIMQLLTMALLKSTFKRATNCFKTIMAHK